MPYGKNAPYEDHTPWDMGQLPDPRLMPRFGCKRRIGFLGVHSLYLIRLDPTPLDSNPVKAPLAQRGEIFLGGDAGVHDDCGLVLALILCGKAVQRVEKRAGFMTLPGSTLDRRGKPPSSVARASVTRGRAFPR